MQPACVSDSCAEQLASRRGGKEDDLVSRENNRCGSPFLVATVVIAARTRRRHSQVLQLAEGGSCSVLSIAATCERVHVLESGRCRADACHGERSSGIHRKETPAICWSLFPSSS